MTDCFDGSSLLLLADRRTIRFDQICPGALVALPDGTAARVTDVVVNEYYRGGLISPCPCLHVTPMHPVLPASSGRWTAPLVMSRQGRCQPSRPSKSGIVYNLILSHGHAIVAPDGTVAATLGHWRFGRANALINRVRSSARDRFGRWLLLLKPRRSRRLKI